MAQLTPEEKALLQEAQTYVYYMVFKDTIFNPQTQTACFTLSQLVTAFREGFNYLDFYGKPSRIDFRHIEFVRVWRVGLSEYVTLPEIPEFKLLLDAPAYSEI